MSLLHSSLLDEETEDLSTQHQAGYVSVVSVRKRSSISNKHYQPFTNNDNARAVSPEMILKLPDSLEQCDEGHDKVTTCTLHHHIFKNKKLKVMRYLAELEDSNKLNKQDKDGRTPLHFAAAKRSACILKLILCFKNVELDKQDSCGRTPFFIAADSNSVACMNELLKRGASPLITDNTGNTPLYHMICNHGDKYFDSVEFLLTVGEYFINAKNSCGQTALHVAAFHGRAVIVQHLIGAGAYVDEIDVKGRTPIVLAVKSNQYETVQLLLDGGADISILDKKNKNVFDHVNQGTRIEFLLKDASRSNSRYSATKNVSGPDSYQVKQIEERIKKLRAEIDDVIIQEHKLEKENRMLEDEIEIEQNDKNESEKNQSVGRKLFTTIRNTSNKLFQREPRQDSQILNEEERTHEMERLFDRYGELQRAYEDLMTGNNDKCEEIEDLQFKIKHLRDKEILMNNTIKELRIKLAEAAKHEEDEKFNEENDGEENEYEELKIQFGNIQQKSHTNQTKWQQDMAAIDDQINIIAKEIDEKCREIKEVTNRVQSLHDKIDSQREEITMVTDKTERLMFKYRKLQQRMANMQGGGNT